VGQKDILIPVIRENPHSHNFKISFPKKTLEAKMKDTIKNPSSIANLLSSLKIR
jgi:hypothetical protein